MGARISMRLVSRVATHTSEGTTQPGRRIRMNPGASRLNTAPTSKGLVAKLKSFSGPRGRSDWHEEPPPFARFRTSGEFGRVAAASGQSLPEQRRTCLAPKP